MLFFICDKLPFNIGTYIYARNVVQCVPPFIYDRNHMYEIHAMYVHYTVIDQYKFLIFFISICFVLFLPFIVH